jgi:hypothetical protein
MALVTIVAPFNSSIVKKGASINPLFVSKRHRVSQELPIIITDDLQEIKKTKILFLI